MTSIAHIEQDQDFQGESPSARDRVQAASLDSQFQALKQRFNDLLDALGITIRDDNELSDQVVRARSLHPEVAALIASKAGWQPKAAVAVATTANITLSGEQTIDGVLTSGSRVLVKNQSTASQNGIYLSAAGAWSRVTDADTAEEIGYAFAYVSGGTANGATTWVMAADSASIDLGVTSLAWAQVGGTVGPLPIAKGGTGAITAPAARLSLGVTAAMDPVVTAATLAAGRLALGVTAAMDPVVTAATLAAGRLALGITAAMDPVVTAATLKAGRAAMGPWNDVKPWNEINVLDSVYGAIGNGIADDRPAIQAAIDAAPDGSVVVIPGGKTYKLSVSAVGPNDWWTADGNPALDTPYNTALAIRNRRNLTIIAEGATFDCDDEYTVTFYKSADCKWIGGKFDGDVAYKTGTKEASAILIERCSNVWAIGCNVDKFYRNVFIYHCAWSGAEACISTDAGYFCFYSSGQLGVVLSGVPPINGNDRSSDTRFIRCIAYAGKYGNFLLANAEWRDCQSFDAGRQGVQSTHVRTDNGGFNVIGGQIYESSDQNSGDIVDGISVSAEGVYVSGGTDKVDGVNIGGGLRITGCRYGIQAIACRNVVIDDVFISGYYLGGVYGLTRDIGGVDYNLRNITIGHVNIGAFNEASTIADATYASKGALILESNDSVSIQNAIISGAVVDGNNGGAITPTDTWYEIKCNDSAVVIGDICVRGTGTQQRTATEWVGYADHDLSLTGAQSVTGVGFKPKRLQIIACQDTAGSAGASHGVGTSSAARAMSYNPTDAKWVQSSGTIVLFYVDSSNYAYADISSMDNDGFTLTWSKSGSPIGGLRMTLLCER